jgi:hypothetical protein
MKGNQGFALPPVKERDASGCMRKHSAFALFPAWMLRETLPHVQGGSRRPSCPPRVVRQTRCGDAVTYPGAYTRPLVGSTRAGFATEITQRIPQKVLTLS